MNLDSGLPANPVRPERVQWYDLSLLIIAGLLFYGRVIGFEVLTNWDDPEYITENPLIREMNWANLKTAFLSGILGNYAPVQTVSYMIDCLLGGGAINPAIFHATNLVLHIANSLLLYWFVIRSAGSRAWAVTAAALFLLHPVQVESVAWLSQRKNLLSEFFFLLAILSYQSYRNAADKRRGIFYGLSIGAAILALFSKVSVVIIPLVLVVYDLTIAARDRRPTGKKSFLEKIPFIIVAGLMAFQSSILQTKELGGGRVGYHGGSLFATMLTMLDVLTDYARLIIWPANLSIIYTPEIVTTPTITSYSMIAVLILIAAACVYVYRRERSLLFGICLFFIGLLPVSQLIPLVTLMNDRYLYISMIGVAWIAGGVVQFVRQRRPRWRQTVVMAGLVLGVVLGFLSYQRSAVWKNSVALWTDATRKQPDNWGVWDALAEAYMSAGDTEGAAAAYEKVFSMKPDFTGEDIKERKALNNAAVLFMDRGQRQKARELLDILTNKYPDYIRGFINLGYLAALDNETGTAEKAYRHALELEPDNTSALMSMGNLCRKKGELKTAHDYFLKAMGNGGDGPELRFAMASLDASEGKLDEALRNIEMAVGLGYRDVRELQTSHDFDLLRKSPRFIRILDSLTQDGARKKG